MQPAIFSANSGWEVERCLCVDTGMLSERGRGFELWHRHHATAGGLNPCVSSWHPEHFVTLSVSEALTHIHHTAVKSHICKSPWNPVLVFSLLCCQRQCLSLTSLLVSYLPLHLRAFQKTFFPFISWCWTPRSYTYFMEPRYRAGLLWRATRSIVVNSVLGISSSLWNCKHISNT